MEKSAKEIKRVFGSSIPPIGYCLPACSAGMTQFTCLLILHSRFVYHTKNNYGNVRPLPQQPGPIYFLTPRKCGIFGICCEALPRQVWYAQLFKSHRSPLKLVILCLQVNYLIDEGMNIGRGANCIISLLHHYLSKHSFGEIILLLHADNCCGQNFLKHIFMQ